MPRRPTFTLWLDGQIVDWFYTLKSALAAATKVAPGRVFFVWHNNERVSKGVTGPDTWVPGDPNNFDGLW